MVSFHLSEPQRRALRAVADGQISWLPGKLKYSGPARSDVLQRLVYAGFAEIAWRPSERRGEFPVVITYEGREALA